MPGSRRSVMRMSNAKSASRCERLFAARRLLDDEAVIGEALGDRLAQRVLVVDDQQMFLAFRHLVRAGGILTPRRQAGQFGLWRRPYSAARACSDKSQRTASAVTLMGPLVGAD